MELKTYIQPAVKVMDINASSLMEDNEIGLYYSVGDDSQLGKEDLFDDEEEDEPIGNNFSVWQ